MTSVVSDVRKDPDYLVRDPETCSELAVPIALDGKVIGVINVEHPEIDAFDEQDWQALQALASQAALAIRNAQLYQELQRQIGTLKALHQAGQAIIGPLALQETLDQIVQQAIRLVGHRQADGCFSHLGLVEGNILCFSAACTSEVLAELREKIDDIDLEHGPQLGITGRAVKTGESQKVGDVSADPDYICFEPRTRSELVVPIKLGERVIGVINVEHPGYDAFSVNDQQALESLAAQAAIAIRNARQNELSQAIYEASKVISSGVTIERRELLNRILEQVATRIRWPQRTKPVLGIIQLYNQETNELCLESVYPRKEFPRLVKRLGERRPLDREKAPGGRIGVNGRAVLEGKVQRVPDVRVDPDYVELDSKTLSELDVPLRIGDRILGMLGLESDRLNAFDEMDERALQALAELSVIAIQNAQLYQDAKRRLGETKALQQVATSLAGTLELETVLHVVMRAALDQTGTDSGSILFWDEQQEAFTHTLTTGPKQVLHSYQTTAREEGGIARAIIDDKKPIVVPDTEKDSRINPVVLEKKRRALMGVPLVSQEKAIGVLYVSNSTPRRFSNRQLALLESLAGQATVAIERARQYEQLKEAKGLIGARTAVAWMGMASSAWRHTIDKHAVTIREQAQLLCQDCQRTASPQQDAKAQRRIDTIQRLATQILDKPITPPLSTESGLESVSLNELIGERTKQLWQNDPYRKVALQLDLRLSDDTTVNLSPEWLKRAFDVLVENAVHAVADREVQEVVIGTRVAKGGVEIFVSDTGPGIPKDVQTKIGLDSIEKSSDTQGLGMGLLMAQTIVHAFSGEIRVISTGPTGTTMAIWLPLAE